MCLLPLSRQSRVSLRGQAGEDCSCPMLRAIRVCCEVGCQGTFLGDFVASVSEKAGVQLCTRGASTRLCGRCLRCRFRLASSGLALILQPFHYLEEAE